MPLINVAFCLCRESLTNTYPTTNTHSVEIIFQIMAICCDVNSVRHAVHPHHMQKNPSQKGCAKLIWPCDGGCFLWIFYTKLPTVTEWHDTQASSRLWCAPQFSWTCQHHRDVYKSKSLVSSRLPRFAGALVCRRGCQWKNHELKTKPFGGQISLLFIQMHPDMIWKSISCPLFHFYFNIIQTHSRHNVVDSGAQYVRNHISNWPPTGIYIFHHKENPLLHVCLVPDTIDNVSNSNTPFGSSSADAWCYMGINIWEKPHHTHALLPSPTACHIFWYSRVSKWLPRAPFINMD